MTGVNSGCMGLSPDRLNDLDEWILDFLAQHEWATPHLMRVIHSDETDRDERLSRQWVNERIVRLEEHDHLERVHADAPERKLVSDPREDGDE